MAEDLTGFMDLVEFLRRRPGGAPEEVEKMVAFYENAGPRGKSALDRITANQQPGDAIGSLGRSVREIGEMWGDDDAAQAQAWEEVDAALRGVFEEIPPGDTSFGGRGRMRRAVRSYENAGSGVDLSAALADASLDDDFASAIGVEVAGTGEPALPGTGTYQGREAARLEEFGRSAPGLTPDQWEMLSPEQQRRYRSMSQSVGIEGAIGQGYVEGSTPSFSAYPVAEAAAAETVSTPAGTTTESVVEVDPATALSLSPREQAWQWNARHGGAPAAGGTSVLPAPGGAPVPGAAPAEPEGGGMSAMSLGGALIGGAGIASAIGNTIADFRTTAALEDQLAASAAGDTVARREGALAGSQAQRNIMATSLGRRDISPALALRNAQMAGSRTLSDVYGQAAIASARERRESEAQLAQLRKQRWNTLFGGLTRTAGDVGALLATQGAAEETAKMNKRLTDLEASNLNQVGLAPGQRRR